LTELHPSPPALCLFCLTGLPSSSMTWTYGIAKYKHTWSQQLSEDTLSDSYPETFQFAYSATQPSAPSV